MRINFRFIEGDILKCLICGEKKEKDIVKDLMEKYVVNVAGEQEI